MLRHLRHLGRSRWARRGEVQQIFGNFRGSLRDLDAHFRPGFRRADCRRSAHALNPPDDRVPVTERVRRLERENIITGYHARLNPHALGQSLLVFVEIKLRSKSGNIFEDFRREVSMIPQILECHLVSGEYDYLIKVRLPDMSAYRDMLGNILLQLPAAAESRSYVVMEEVKENALLALD